VELELVIVFVIGVKTYLNRLMVKSLKLVQIVGKYLINIKLKNLLLILRKQLIVAPIVIKLLTKLLILELKKSIRPVMLVGRKMMKEENLIPKSV
jgi:hypothetical protein